MADDKIDRKWMKIALRLALRAKNHGEVPVGAVIVHNLTNTLISWGYNKKEELQSPLAHAETLAIHRASKKLGNWRIEDCTLYVTLEPCLMCAGAILQSRIARVVYGARDPKAGAVRSLFTVLEDSRLNHWCKITEGVLEKDASLILKNFFKELRAIKKKVPFELN
jgi:tRNA(adenine34) deaminase